MRRYPATHGFAPLIIGLALLLAGNVARPQTQVKGQGIPAQRVLSQEVFPAVAPATHTGDLPAVVALPGAGAPLSDRPYVFKLDRLPPAQMSPADAAAVSSLSGELSARAALANFDLAESGWTYEQIVCPAFPDYIFLAYSHGPEPNGSSEFVAVLARNGSQARVVSSSAHGSLPFEAAWKKTGTYEVFNQILRQERNTRPMSSAPNWLVISMCFAELSGHHVQVLTPRTLSGAYLDLLRLRGIQPQMRVNPDHSAEVTFSDASKPRITTQWTLRYDRRGQLTSVAREGERQPAKIALKP